MIDHLHSEATIEDYFAIKTLMNKQGIAVPLDPVHLAYSNPHFFDAPYKGPLVGALVEVEAGTIWAGEIPGASEELPGMVGEVIAHCHGRIVVALTGTNLYVGWYGADEFRVLQVADHMSNISLN